MRGRADSVPQIDMKKVWGRSETKDDGEVLLGSLVLGAVDRCGEDS